MHAQQCLLADFWGLLTTLPYALLQVPAAAAVRGVAETAQHVQTAVAEAVAPALAPAPALAARTCGRCWYEFRWLSLSCCRE